MLTFGRSDLDRGIYHHSQPLQAALAALSGRSQPQAPQVRSSSQRCDYYLLNAGRPRAHNSACGEGMGHNASMRTYQNDALMQYESPQADQVSQQIQLREHDCS